MKTRGGSNRRRWPGPGPLLKNSTQTVTLDWYTPTWSAKESSHASECTLHFGDQSPFEWERKAWLRRGLRKHSNLRARCAAILQCGHRCGRPFLRTSTRDQQWTCCGAHGEYLPKRQPILLKLPGELRNEIYKHAFPPFLGLFPQDERSRSSIGLLGVNKQIHKEVISLMYRNQPLRLRYDRDGLNLDTLIYD